MLVPVKVAHAEESEAMLTYAGSLIRILPFELSASFIVTENVYDVIRLTISLPLAVRDPVKVVEIGVKDW
jgi:hypothetical protein